MKRRGGAISVEDLTSTLGLSDVSGSVTDRVARALGLDILSGRIAPGENIPREEDLRDRFGVSRTVLREAVRVLIAKGLVTSKTRVGTLVRPPQNWNYFDAEVLAWRVSVGLDANLLQSLREARMAVEPFAARLAAMRASPAEIAEMAESVHLMQSALDDRALFARADLRFHRAVAAASGNFVLGSFASVIETALVCATLLLPLEKKALRTEAVARHAELLDAVRQRDPDRASKLMADMIGFGAQVGEQPPAGAQAG